MARDFTPHDRVCIAVMAALCVALEEHKLTLAPEEVRMIMREVENVIYFCAKPKQSSKRD